MKRIISFLVILFAFGLSVFSQSNTFLNDQKKYKRVRTAFSKKEQIVNENLQKNSLSASNLNILIVAYKAEKILEIYGKKKSDLKYKKIADYKVCHSSGSLGPKRKESDLQVLEGFYHIDRFNPSSSYYLSLGINYPNKSDKIISRHRNLGGDIFIHGKCVTIGCLPMTDDKIKEIYLYAVFAKNNGQTKIPVYIFPFKMTEKNAKDYSNKYKRNVELISFWNNLKIGYDKFDMEKKELEFVVDRNGNYVF